MLVISRLPAGGAGGRAGLVEGGDEDSGECEGDGGQARDHEQVLVVHELGLHAGAFQLNASALSKIGGAIVGYSGGACGASGGVEGCAVVSETAQVELRSGRV